MSPADDAVSPAIASLPAAVADVDDDRILSSSVRFDEMFGYRAGALAGRALSALVGPEERSELAELSADGHGVGAEGPRELQVGGIGGDGMPFVVRLTIGDSDRAGRHWVSAVPSGPPVLRPEDPAPDYVRRSPWELLGVDRVLSHDIRAALRGSNSFLSLLDRAVGDQLAAEAGEFLATAAAASGRADDMVEKLVRLLRIGIRPVRARPVLVSAALDDAAALSGSAFPGDPATLHGEAGSMALADPGMLVECLSEIITNARKFAGGSVVIDVSETLEAGWLYLRLGDNGPGIPPEFDEDVFNPFRLLQAKGRYPGVGLGLTTCREIARVHGGRIWVADGTVTPDSSSGTTIVLRIPAAV